MDAAVKLLNEFGWVRAGTCDSEYDKPVFAWRDWKCMVGRTWTTLWRYDGRYVCEIDSYKTEHLEALADELRVVMAPPPPPPPLPQRRRA
jgi:hypothetical protein